MAYSTTYEYQGTLLNRGFSIDMRHINSLITDMFQRYSTALNDITGGELYGKRFIRQL